ncbi:sulfotransferase [Egicoccus sp. AB-alg2]|uniref:sulfotransferase family protein n=1 Tax=Egicoccus sp. AB-alg2 TaxID=3242693 RepID=UPI00359D43ED
MRDAAAAWGAEVSAGAGGALPNVLVIGAMKAGTSALHRYLDAHPDAAMSHPKELGFFFDVVSPGDGLVPPPTRDEHRHGWSLGGNWFRGLDWYRQHFAPDARVRGETSPGYTSPDHPEVAARIAATLGTDLTLVMLVRDPVARALSQYAHHRRDGHESRPVEVAVLDPASQYLARSRYAERLDPFLTHFPRERIEVVVQEELRAARRCTLQRLYAALGLDPDHWDAELDREWHVGDDVPDPGRGVRDALCERLRDDVDRLRAFLDRDLPWSC